MAAQDGFWGWLYEWGPIPAVAVTLVLIGVMIVGLKHERLARWRRVCLFVILTGAIGAGVITNGLLKEYWGRPRPREIQEFGGRYPFEAILTIDEVSDGKSFPAGHPTMGFFFLAGYFIFRRRGDLAAASAFLIGGLAFGGVLGYMRLIQGGHFVTDSIWSAGVMFLTSATLFHALGLNRELLRTPAKRHEKIPTWAKVGGGLLGVLAIGAVLVGTPYHDQRDVITLDPLSDELPLRIELDILEGDVVLSDGEKFTVKGEAWGHGVPTSRIVSQFRERPGDDGSTMKLRYYQRPSGYLTESNQDLEISIPWGRVKTAELQFGSPGAITIALGEVDFHQRIKLGKEEGADLEILVGATPVWCPPDVAKQLGLEDSSDLLDSPTRPALDQGLIELQMAD